METLPVAPARGAIRRWPPDPGLEVAVSSEHHDLPRDPALFHGRVGLDDLIDLVHRADGGHGRAVADRVDEPCRTAGGRPAASAL